MKEISARYQYKIENLRICDESSVYGLISIMTMFYERNYVVSHVMPYDREKSQYFMKITTAQDCDDFFEKCKQIFPEWTITKTTTVTTTTVETTEEVLG